MIIKTNDLYQLAQYMCWGAEIERSYGTYPNVVFQIKINKLNKFFADRIPFVSWKPFKRNRLALKRYALGGFYNKTTIGDIYPELLN